MNMNIPCNSNLIRRPMRQHACARCIAPLLLLLLALPGAMQAQFNYTVTNGAVTITGYTGPGGAVAIPSRIDGLPVTCIGYAAFINSMSLTEVTIPDSVSIIGEAAFDSCARLSNVTIGNSVTSIGDYAFGRCTGLTNIAIGNGVTSIGDYTFEECTGLTVITVDAANPNYSSLAGVLFNKTQTTLIAYPDGKAGAYTIPSSVASIGSAAFYYCTGLTGISIPNSVTNIGTSAFQSCTSLTSVTIPNSVTDIGGVAFRGCTSLTSISIPNSVTNIGTSAFESCTSLTSVTIPNSVSNIGDRAFNNCTGLTNVTIPNSVISIGDEAFACCTGLTNVTIPASVTTIGIGPFDSCTSLTAITVDALNPNYSSLAGVLFNKSQTTLIAYPDRKAGGYTIPSSVTSIGDLACRFCTSLTSIAIGNSVTNIGTSAFESCSSLTSVTIPNSVTNIGDRAFNNCTGLTSVTIPNSVTSIGLYAFGFCSNLTSVTIGTSVTNIGDSAFAYCTRLAGVRIPNSVTNIGNGLFSFCTSLTSATIPNSVLSIGAGAFLYCTGLTNVMIGIGVGYIGHHAFYHCTALTGVYFQGDAPRVFIIGFFEGDYNATVYYLPGTTGWASTFALRPTAIWPRGLWPPPAIQMSPQSQTAEAGSVVDFRAKALSPLPLLCRWYLNYTNLISSSPNSQLELANVQLSQSGAYTVVFNNSLGAATSAPAMLQVIPPVQRRIVPALTLMGQPGSSLNLDFATAVGPASQWTTFDNMLLTQTSQWYFDLSMPLPPQRFYRAWQTGTSGGPPSLSLLGLIPAITLTGNIGDTFRVDYINQFGPTDAWVPLATNTLTTSPQLYFDTSAIGQPPRLWRIVPVP